MFEHFDDGARRCVVLAQQEARRLGHEEIGTVHLLLGVAGVEAELIGVEIQAIRAAVVALQGSTTAPIRNWLPFSPEATLALEAANSQALSRGHTVIDAAHLLLALMEAGGGAARALREAGAVPGAVRERASAAAGRGPQRLPAPALPEMPIGPIVSGARPERTDHAEHLRSGDPVPVTLGTDARGIGDLGHPSVDAYLLELLLVNDTIAARLLRAHGIDEILLREVFGANAGPPARG